MSATLNFEMRDTLAELREDGRLAVLIALLLHSNLRMRCYPSLDLLVKETGWSIASVNTAKNWLIERAAIVIVPHDKRVDDELQLPPRQNVYQLTGVIAINGKLIPYLYLNKKTQDQVNTLVAKVLPTKVLEGKVLLTKDKVDTSIKDNPSKSKSTKKLSSANATAPNGANRVAGNAIISLQSLTADQLSLLRDIEAEQSITYTAISEFYSLETANDLEELELIERHDCADLLWCYQITEKGKQVLEAKPIAKATHKLGDSDYEVLRFVKLNTGGDAKYVTGLMARFEQAIVDYLLYMDLLGVQYGELDDLYWITPDGIKALEAKPIEKPKAKKGRKPAYVLTDSDKQILQFVETSGSVSYRMSGANISEFENLVKNGYLEIEDNPVNVIFTLTAKGRKAIGAKKPKERDLLFDVLDEHVTKKNKGLTGKAKKALLESHPNATAEGVINAVKHYKATNPTLSLTGWQKFPGTYTEWLEAGSPIYTDNGVIAKENDFSELHKPAPKWHIE